MHDEQNKAVDNEQLYRELFTPVFRYVFFRTRDRDLASDLTQSSFLKYMLQKKKTNRKTARTPSDLYHRSICSHRSLAFIRQKNSATF